MSPTQNHLNLIRACAALMVLISHSYALSSGDPKTEPWQDILGMTPGGMAVYIFFAISGYLLTGSIARTGSWQKFILSRVFRIYPALIAALMVSTLVIGFQFTSLTPSEYFSNPQTWRYLVKNSVMIVGAEAQLPGAFASNPFPDAVNGSLWTLRHELRLYVALGLIWFVVARLGRTASKPWQEKALLGVAGILLAAVGGTALMAQPVNTVLLLATLFFSGSACWILSQGGQRLPSAPVALALAAFMVAAGWRHPGLFALLLSLVLPWFVMALAHARCAPLLNFNRLGDYSYGIYLYAFPVQQALMSLNHQTSTWALTAGAIPITVVLAVASWHLLEKPCLALAKRLGR